MTTRRIMLAIIAGAAIAPSALTCNVASQSENLDAQVLRAHKKASVVVLAKVVAAGFREPLASPFGESPTHHVRLEVIESWKGTHKPGSVIDAFSPTKPGTCAIVLTPGETYLLYLGNKAPYDISSSHRSVKFEVSAQEVDLLRSRYSKPSS